MRYTKEIRALKPYKTYGDAAIIYDQPDTDTDFFKGKYAGVVKSLLRLARLFRGITEFAVTMRSRQCRLPIWWHWKQKAPKWQRISEGDVDIWI